MTKKTGLQITEAALKRVATERYRQVDTEGYNFEHDDAHTDGAIACAAAAYIGYSLRDLGHFGPPPGSGFSTDVDNLIGCAPWSIRPKDPLDCLVKAAALIVAEIERRDRAAQ